MVDGKRSVVGCVSLAMGMLMSYHGYPETLDGQSVNWSLVRQDYYYYQIPKILASLGSSLKSNYGATSTSTSLNNVVPVLRELGYSCDDSFKSTYPAAMSLYTFEKNNPKRTPLLIYGNADIENNPTGGHVWILDGSLKYIYPPSLTFNGEELTESYIHCVWGQYGSGNGYFRAEHLGGYRHSKDSTDGIFPLHGDQNPVGEYKNIQILFNTRPNK